MESNKTLCTSQDLFEFSEVGRQILLVGGVDEGLQHVVHLLPRLPALPDHLEEDVLDLDVSSVPFPISAECLLVNLSLPLCERSEILKGLFAFKQKEKIRVQQKGSTWEYAKNAI